MLHEPLIVLDFETTGLRPEAGDRITEVGLVRIEGGRITARFESLVNCEMRIPDYITAFTGITQRMVDTAPLAQHVLREVVQFIGEAPVVAHNASFDQRFYLRECRRQRVGVVAEPFICSMRVARRVYPEMMSHSLGVLSHSLGLRDCGKAHRAAADAETTAELMLRMGHDVAARHGSAAVSAATLRRLMRMPVARVQVELEKLCA
ncbi:MAG: 3'-5' exonuclease [Steroidobacteraceae bacterium]